jgi:hypothetical protein
MNPTRLLKEVLLPDRACWDMQGTKGDRVQTPRSHWIGVWLGPSAHLDILEKAVLNNGVNM